LKLPSDFGNEISKALNWKLEQVAEWFTLEEDKEGYFWARLKPKKLLEKPEFKTMCARQPQLEAAFTLRRVRLTCVAAIFVVLFRVTRPTLTLALAGRTVYYEYADGAART
jgi:hypothetical protein